MCAARVEMQLRRARAGKAVTIKPSSSSSPGVGDSAVAARSVRSGSGTGRRQKISAATGRGDAAAAGKTATPPARRVNAPGNISRTRAT